MESDERFSMRTAEIIAMFAADMNECLEDYDLRLKKNTFLLR